MQLTPRDLYRLRHARLVAQRATLRAQLAQQQVHELSLEMERRYGLLAKEAALDIQTGIITLPVTAPVTAKGQPIIQPADITRSEEVMHGPAHDKGKTSP